MLITLEGIDGTGKTTQAKLLVKELGDRGIAAKFTREPGGTALGEAIRQLIFEKKMIVSPVSELLLFCAARAQLVSEVIIPALSQGEIVVCDRFIDSTVAYQGYGRGIPLEHVRWLNHLAAGSLVPDLTILLDADPETALRRNAGTDEGLLRNLDMSFFHRVRQGYLELAGLFPERIRVIDARGPVEEVFRGVWKTVELFWKSRGDGK